MTASQQIKETLIEYLIENTPDVSIAIVDGKQRAEIELPTIAVDVVGTAAHSTALSNVTTGQAQIVLRHHAGDESAADVPTWIDELESMFFDKSRMVDTLNSTGVMFFDWNYNGSTQDFDDAILEVTFTADILFARQ